MTDRVLKAEAKSAVLPSIPAKRYFTIGEVSELCGVKPHVLRYWEQEFPQLKPVKRRGNRRYYQRHDVLVIRQIRSLLYEQGFTIGGARQRLSSRISEVSIQIADEAIDMAEDMHAATAARDPLLDRGLIRRELAAILDVLKGRA